MNHPSYILEGTAENFAALVLENSRKGPVLVDFWAPWVGPSHKQRELLTRLADAYGGRFLLVTVNTDQQKALAREYNIRSLPLSKLFRHAKVVETFHGVQPEADFRKGIDRHLVKESDVLWAAALRNYQRGDVDKALQQLADVALADPENLGIPADIAKILLAQGRLDEADRLLSSLPREAQEDAQIGSVQAHLGFLQAARTAPPLATMEEALREHPADLENRYRLSALRLVQDDYELALEHLYQILRQDRGFRNDIGRRGLLAVFQILGEDHELVARYRALMFNALH